MNIDDYREQVVDLLKSGNAEALEDAANCVLYCSESGLECSTVIDTCLGGLDDTVDTEP